jgi:hypothetical protein
VSNSMDNRAGKKRSSMSNKWSISISSDSIINNISNISIISIGMVSNMLCTTIRKSNRVRSRDTTGTISSFSSIKTRARIVIIDSISIGVRIGLISIDRSSMGNKRACNKRRMGDEGGMGDNWSMGNSNGVRHSMDNWVTYRMDTSKDWSMSNNPSSTMKTVGRVSYSSNTSSKSLGLSGASVFSLVWL